VPIGARFHSIGVSVGLTRGSFDSANELTLDEFAASPTQVLSSVAELLLDEIDSLNLRRVADDPGDRLQAQWTAKHE
jgi:hypothetical protein